MSVSNARIALKNLRFAEFRNESVHSFDITHDRGPLTISEAKALLAAYFEAYPEIAEWLERCKEPCEKFIAIDSCPSPTNDPAVHDQVALEGPSTK